MPSSECHEHPRQCCGKPALGVLHQEHQLWEMDDVEEGEDEMKESKNNFRSLDCGIALSARDCGLWISAEGLGLIA